MNGPVQHPSSDSNRRGVAAMASAMASLAFSDALVKFVSEALPPPQLILVRGVFSIVLLLALVCATGGARHLPRLLDARVVLRAGVDAIATIAYLLSLFHLPLANTTAINMAAPLFVTLYAIALFGERVAARRWLAVATGFAGVLLVVQPRSDGFNAWALLCVLASFLNASRDVLTRTIGKGVPVLVIALSTSIAVTLLAGGWSLMQPWKPVTGSQLGLLAAAATVLSAGNFLIAAAMRHGEMSVVAPFRYSGLIVALALGWFIWGTVPNALALAGIVLLVAAGLALLRGSRTRASVARVEARQGS